MKSCRQPTKLKWLLKQPVQWSTLQRNLGRFLALEPGTTALRVIAPVLC
jgi:hypothetical protein